MAHKIRSQTHESNRQGKVSKGREGQKPKLTHLQYSSISKREKVDRLCVCVCVCVRVKFRNQSEKMIDEKLEDHVHLKERDLTSQKRWQMKGKLDNWDMGKDGAKKSLKGN